MLIKLFYLPVLLTSISTGRLDKKQDWRIHVTAPCVHALIGVASAVMALPFGLRAAALAPIAIGLGKGIFDHYAKRDADPTHFAWIMAGTAFVVGSVKLAALA